MSADGEPNQPGGGGAAAAAAAAARTAATAASTARRAVTICNQKGLHARAAARFVKTAAQFDAEIWVRKNGTAVSGRSIMGLMMLAAATGTRIEISATGHDAAAAIDTLARLIECKFDEA